MVESKVDTTAVSRKRFGFVLLPEFPLLPLSCMVDALEDANYVGESDLYDWCYVSIGDPYVTAANGLTVAADCDIRSAPPLDTVVVCSAFNAPVYQSHRLSHWLNRCLSSGARVGAIATGTWLLAFAGLLEGRKCTIHWEEIPSFREKFPTLDISTDLFEIDGPIFTCAGGTATIDLFLHFISDDFGAELSGRVAQQIMYPNVRSGDERQPVDSGAMLHVHRGVAKATRIMQSNVESPLSLEEIAAAGAMSLRQMERQFRNMFDQTPQDYYRNVRLEHARNLIRLTDLPMYEIATACGFSSASYLARCHRQRFGHSPSAERARPRSGANRATPGRLPPSKVAAADSR